MAARRERLAQRRMAMGFSQEKLAEYLGVERSTIGRWEGGKATPQPWNRPKLAQLLRISIEELAELLADRESAALALRSPPGVPSPTDGHYVAHAPTSQTPAGVMIPIVIDGHPVLVPLGGATVAASGLGILMYDLAAAGHSSGTTQAEGRDSMTPLDRRTLLTRSFAAAALPMLGLDELEHVARALTDAPRYLDGSVVDYFHRQLAQCKADDGNLGPAKALPVVLGILGAIQQHAREVRSEVRQALLLVGADSAEFAGWLYRDIGSPTIAGYWHDRAIEWAQEAGDLPMQGYVLLKKSQMAYEERDAVRVLGLARAAQTGPWNLPAHVRAEVTQQEARGLAMLGEPLGIVEKKLDDAYHLFASADGSDEHPHLGPYFNDGTMTLRTASCYIEAGKPARAAMLYGTVISSDVLSRRDEGYFRARRAAALALSGEPDDAAQEGLAAMELATTTSSQRTARELRRALHTLAPWSARPGPQALRDALQP